MPLINLSEVDIIDVGNGEQVTIKCRMTKGDRTRLADGMIKARQIFGSQEADLGVLAGAMQLESLRINIVSWTIKDGDQIAPLTKESIARLPEETADLILEEIDKRNPTRTAEKIEELKNAPSTPSTISPGEQAKGRN